ncbi:cytochrome c biogenesis protein ResB [Stackebrandtia nassauensis]|uniref:ResB family protein n=1 Tax=Stackebrandtia nassauensis (strain DSM 44728 / CIP 108903 / NRRL B-16338 / NBRC 102104 / LLR-40K-21) TaxID=446470 RepID=D3Q832_STANL|nr:cytochrome c biogenesis protein ResB [Stackebrandtia nassauensis]ADD40537.1 ResB family protein [Stackebrandtia nassauensis DSM 44728]
MNTTPRRSIPQRVKATARRWWRQLTSMRTALVLLFGLAVAAVPGSLLPQRNLSVDQVNTYFSENPDLAPVLDRLWAFDVYSSPWFAAIYLLLFTSLVGCLVPRFRDHVKALRRRPPDAPARMSLLPQHRELTDAPDREQVVAVLRRNRFRVTVREREDGVVTVSAEKGYAREAGNLLFHFSLLALLAGMAFGSLFGWHGNRLLVEGEEGAFCNSLQQYDQYGLGPNIGSEDLPPFCMQLDRFTTNFLDNGQPTQYTADVRYGQNGQAPSDEYRLEVNHPLELDGASVFLLGHGYAAEIEFTDKYGNKQTTIAPFLGEDGVLTSTGAAVFPDANINPDTGKPDKNSQIAFEGLFIPSVPDQPPYTNSTSPKAEKPGLMLSAFIGDTGLDSGKPQSVYSVDKDQIASGALKPVNADPKLLTKGETWELDDGMSVTFKGVRDYATLEVRHDPGEMVVLAAAVAVLIGLLPALTVRRRRIWVRLNDGTAEAGGLARTEYDGFAEEFEKLASAIETNSRQPQEMGMR